MLRPAHPWKVRDVVDDHREDEVETVARGVGDPGRGGHCIVRHHCNPLFSPLFNFIFVTICSILFVAIQIVPETCVQHFVIRIYS